MAVLTWDAVGQRFYETGCDRGVLYTPNSSGVYATGVAWSGLVNVTESPSGAEANAQYADNLKYLNLYSAEEFGCTIEAFMAPDEFNEFDGMVSPVAGVLLGQQARKTFGLCYRTLVGNDVDGNEHAYKLHLVYGCKASPSEVSHATVNDSPEPVTFSWEVTTTPVAVTGYKPVSHLIVDSREADPTKLLALEALLYGTELAAAQLPAPATVITTLT